MSDEATQSQATAPAAPPIRLQQPDEYRAERAHIFPSAESFRWFVRHNRAELIAAGALMIPTGRWLVQPELFDRCLVAIGLRKAAEKKHV